MENIKDAVKKSMNGNNDKITKKNKDTIFDLVMKQIPGFKLALPPDFSADRFARLLLTALRNNPKLQQCTPESFLASAMLAAQAGLEPNTPLHEASIIPYNNKTQNKIEAQFQIEYRGLIKLAYNSGLVLSIDYDKIAENDTLVFIKGTNPKFEHTPSLKGDRGNAYAYYAIAEIQGGGKALVVKTKEEILKHAQRFSQSYKYDTKSAWHTDMDAMAIKTCLKELCDKKLPRRTTPEALKFAQVLTRDETIARLNDTQFADAVNSGAIIKAEDIEVEELITTAETNVVESKITLDEKNINKPKLIKMVSAEDDILSMINGITKDIDIDALNEINNNIDGVKSSKNKQKLLAEFRKKLSELEIEYNPDVLPF